MYFVRCGRARLVTVTVLGTTLETPPTQANGGGYKLDTVIGHGHVGDAFGQRAAINVNFLLGVQQTGSFRFHIIVEALP